MWEYKEVYVENQDLIETLASHGRQGWEAFQIEKVEIQKESYGDKWLETNYKIYLKRCM